MHLADEAVHVLPPPVAAVHAPSVTGISQIIRNGQPFFGIRIEIVVDVYAVHVVAQQNVRHHVADIVAVLGYAGIHNQHAAIFEIAVGMQEIGMCLGQLLRAFRLGTVRIDPRMQLHAPRVALPDHPFQRIPIGRGRCALPPGQVTAPRFEATGIERVEFWAHLKQDGVDAAFLQLVQLVGQRPLHLHRTHPHELVIHTLYPRAPELAFGRQLGRQREAAQPHQQKQKRLSLHLTHYFRTKIQ